MRVRTVSRLAAIVGVAALSAALFACGGSDEDSSSDGVFNGDGGGIATQPSGDGGSATKPPATEGKELVVSMTDNKFTPNKITVKAGEAVTFVAKNEGSAVHNMKILSKSAEGKDYASAAMVNPSQESKFTVTFTKKGTLKFQCDFHLPDMVGTIEVQ